MANQMAFEQRVTNASGQRNIRMSGILIDEKGKTIEANNGLLCVPVVRTRNSKYTRLNETQAYMKAASASDTAVYAVSSANQTDIRRNGAVRRMGTRLTASIPKGTACNFERLVPGSVVAFGEGNFIQTPNSKQPFCTIENGKLKANETPPESGIFFSFLSPGVFVAGRRAKFKRFTMLVCRSGAEWQAFPLFDGSYYFDGTLLFDGTTQEGG